MKIALVSDAWSPQINGVVRTLTTTIDHLCARGHAVVTLTPDRFRTVPCPTYPDIRLAIGCGRGVADILERAVPHAVYIATEGPLGWAARRWCLANDFPFTTSFHTHFAHYLASGLPIAAFPVPGPLDVLGADGCGRGGRPVGILDEALEHAIARALELDRTACVAEATHHSWSAATDQFLAGLAFRSEAGAQDCGRMAGSRSVQATPRAVTPAGASGVHPRPGTVPDHRRASAHRWDRGWRGR